MNVIHEASARTHRRRETRTETILDAAMRVLGRDGIDGLTLQAVAAELGLVTTALYRYFPSKNALLAALQRRTVTTLHGRLTAHVAALAAAHPGEHPHVQALLPIVALPGFYAAAKNAMPEAFRMLMTMLGDPRLLLEDADALQTAPLLGAMLGEVAALFGRAAACGALPAADVAEQTVIVWATLQGTLALGKLGRFDARMADPEALGKTALAALLRGWGAAAAEVERALVLTASPVSAKLASPRKKK